ncbi:MAG: hypothetical protein P8Y99_08210 [Calditrichaceae bacterium]
MEIIGILIAVVIIIAFVKLLGILFHAGVWVIALPFKILFAVIGAIISVAIFVPLGVFGVLASIIVIPLALIIPLAPFLIIGLGIWLLVRKNS